ncbi:GDP-mannose 4,6-dehydratase [Aeromicrobium panaciterrae]|uniref:GDP-mannose 4,6-dehydratase n=1 Tax=Aeromicrobium panaciterrae TaxID=363861 RepID=UPI0031D881EE
MTQTALITGVAGQDGVLLARHLMATGYRVVGTTQPGVPTTLRPYLDGVELEEHDLRDPDGFVRLLGMYEPTEVYNLAGFTSVGASWDNRELVMDVNAVAVESMLETLLKRGGIKFFQASSSEVFGPDAVNLQDEQTPHDPQNPYAESKSRAQQAVVRARDEGLFAAVGVLYNHESALRPPQFVTRKITRAAAEIAAGISDTVTLGNLEVSRDWGAAHDYVVAMHAALQQPVPSDYIIATGKLHTLGQLLEVAFAAVGIDDPWPHVQQDPALLRKADAPGLSGDASKARSELDWSPTSTFEDLVREMVAIDQKRLKSGVEEDPAYLE